MGGIKGQPESVGDVLHGSVAAGIAHGGGGAVSVAPHGVGIGRRDKGLGRTLVGVPVVIVVGGINIEQRLVGAKAELIELPHAFQFAHAGEGGHHAATAAGTAGGHHAHHFEAAAGLLHLASAAQLEPRELYRVAHFGAEIIRLHPVIDQHFAGAQLGCGGGTYAAAGRGNRGHDGIGYNHAIGDGIDAVDHVSQNSLVGTDDAADGFCGVNDCGIEKHAVADQFHHRWPGGIFHGLHLELGIGELPVAGELKVGAVQQAVVVLIRGHDQGVCTTGHERGFAAALFAGLFLQGLERQENIEGSDGVGPQVEIAQMFCW